MVRATDAALAANPEVSVVVIGYNDRANLPRAIRSVQRQTLQHVEILVVDDASSDDSVEVAERIAAKDARVRVIRLPENSGGCSAPRNAGIDAARAPYVMFLDSDDVYDRHACKAMLLTAERTGVDVVSGQVQRVHVNRGIRTGWTKRLYRSRQVYRGIRDNPELFFDPLSTNKLYRREFLDQQGIRFPVGVHYEDSLFSTKVYCLANGIALIPNLVYFWRVVKDDEETDAAELSITQRRFEIQNFRDRIAVHRMMDEFMAEHGFGDLKARKDVKFVRHDLRLYLRDLRHRDDGYQQEMMRTAAEYLATVSDETLALLNPVERICVHMLRRGDLDETLRTIDYLKFGYKLSTYLVERDGRVYWTEKYLDSPADREILDVTEMGFDGLPFGRLPLYNEVHAMGLAGSALQIEGRVYNQLGRIPRDADLELFVTARNRGRVLRRRERVAHVRHEGDVICYRADVPIRPLLGPLDLDEPIWDLRLDIAWGDRESSSPFSIDPGIVPSAPLPVRGRLGGLARAHVEAFCTTRMNLSLQQVSRDSVVDKAAAKANWFTTKARLTVLWRTRNTLNSPTLKRKAYNVFRRLPVKRGLVVFESHMGRQYSDSPRYIYEAARETGFAKLGITPVWSHQWRRPVGFPPESGHVRRESWRYHWAMARAEFWVDNQGFPRHLSRRPETTYIQTWHGTPLKRMGFDSPALERASVASRRQHKAMMRRWSALLVPSEYYVETFAKSYRYEGELLRVGLPRNDRLVRGISDEERRELKRRLDVPEDRPVVLYAPTFRDRARRLGRAFDVPFEMMEVQRALGTEIFLMIRTHYLDSHRLSDRFRTFAADYTRHHDVTELLLIADVLVTDYSSVMFDFANTGKPMVFYTHDYEDYARDERGTYVDLAEVAPGPMVTDTDGLVAALGDLDGMAETYRDRYDKFRARFCEYETGHASEAVVEHFFDPARRAR